MLRVQVAGKGSWALPAAFEEKMRLFGIGPYSPRAGDGITLAMAREAAREMRSLIDSGIDPKELKQALIAAK